MACADMVEHGFLGDRGYCASDMPSRPKETRSCCLNGLDGLDRFHSDCASSALSDCAHLEAHDLCMEQDFDWIFGTGF